MSMLQYVETIIQNRRILHNGNEMSLEVLNEKLRSVLEL